MKSFIRILTILPVLLVFFLGELNATIYQTVANGNWNSSSIWSPSKPTFPWGSTDTVIINHNVNLNKNITTYGVVIVSSGASLANTSKNITVGDGSTFTNNGTVSVKNFNVDWGTTEVINNGSLTTAHNMTLNEGDFTNNGTISVGHDLVNSYDSDFENTSTGVITVSRDFTNRDIFTNAGSITTGRNFVNDWGYTVSNTGTISAGADVKNRGTLNNSGTLTATDDILNDWSCVITNSGTVTAGDDFTNNGDITNTNVITIGDDFSNNWGAEVTNYGAIEVTDDVSNNGDIHNDGSFDIDGNYTGSGDVDGTGSLCNSDGVTDPTGGAKKVTCPICGDGSTLPVEIIEFTSFQSNYGINLKWITASEINNDRFEIEKSTNGVDFDVIGFVNGNGNSNIVKEYSFLDNKPQSGVNYYRLAQVDFDGKIHFSKIVKLNLKLAVFEVNVYPNPIRQGENLNLLFNNDGKKYIEFYDLSGKLIRNITTSENNYSINSSELIKGILILRITSQKATLVRRIQIN